MRSTRRLGLLTLVLVCWIGQGKAAGPIAFDLESFNVGAFTPLSQTVTGVTASFSSALDFTGPKFSIQTPETAVVTLSQFSGRFLYPNALGVAPMTIAFSEPLTSITLTFATVEDHIASSMHLTAYLGSNEVGSTIGPGAFFPGDTYPQGTFTFSGATFDRVELKVPLQGTEPAVAFFVDSVIVNPADSGAPALQGNWQFDEGAGQTAFDSVGGYDGQLGSTPVADADDPEWGLGRLNDGLWFGGAQFVQIPSAPALSPSATSVEAWVKSGSAGSPFQYIVSKGANASCTAGSYGLRTGALGGAEFVVFDAGGMSLASPQSTSLVWNNRWHYLVGTFDGETARLFVDGTEIGAGVAAPVPFAIDYTLAPDQRLAIGTYLGGGCAATRAFTGDIDHVGIWQGALSAADVAMRYAALNLPFATDTTLTVSPSGSSHLGDPVTLSAMVNSNNGPAGGTVEFFDGGASLGSVVQDSGFAQLVVTTLAAGDHVLTAAYTTDDPLYHPSTSAPVNHTVTGTTQPAETTTVLGVVPPTSVVTQPVTMTAHVSAAGSTVAGDVQFYNGAALLQAVTLVNGAATLSTPNLPVGSHSLSARFIGNADFAESTSDVVVFTVAKANTGTTLSAVPLASAFGDQITLTATVSIIAPGSGDGTGTVQFFDGVTPIATVALVNGKAVSTIDTLGVGQHALMARFVGTEGLNTSQSSPVTVTVSPTPTTATLTSAPNPSVFTQAVTLSVAVSSTKGTPTGEVRFSRGGVPVGTVALANGQATLTQSGLGAGTYTFGAEYLGASTYAPSTSNAVAHTVGKAHTATTLAVAPLTLTKGSPVTLTAAVAFAAPASGLAAGVVRFFDGASLLGEVALTRGQAVFTTSTLAVGPHQLLARFVGTPDINASESAPVSVTVGKMATATTLTTSPNPSVFSAAVTLSATVTAVGGGSVAGQVRFHRGTTLLGSANLVTGVATLVTSGLAVGVNPLVAEYVGTADTAPSTSATVAQTVQAMSTATALNVSALTTNAFEPVTLTATVTSVAPASAGVSGLARFFDGSTLLAEVPLAAGTATFTTSTLTVGSHLLTARYMGSGDANPSTSSVVTVIVNRAASVVTVTSSENPVLIRRNNVGVKLTVRVAAVRTAAGTPTGSVSLFENGVLIASKKVQRDGDVSISHRYRAPGLYVLTAVYSGSTLFSGATSAALEQIVQ